jgi:membrane-bound lytic murein transglycosylase F
MKVCISQNGKLGKINMSLFVFVYFSNSKRTGMLFFWRVLFVITISFTMISCSNQHNSVSENGTDRRIKARHGEANQVFKSGKLRAVTNYGSLSYFIYRGEPMGYQYELLRNLCTHLDVELELILEKDLLKSIEMLRNGEVDVLAMGLTMTKSRQKELLFTDPILITRQVLVQRKPDGWRTMATADEIESHLIRSTLELANKEIYVETGTVFETQLSKLSDDIADSILVVADQREVEQLITAVASGEIDLTVADEHVALVNRRYYPNLDVSTPLSFPQKVAWALNVHQPVLADTINSWIKKFNNDLVSRLIFNKYFKNPRSGQISRSHFYSYKGAHLSPYDSLIQQGASLINWDWRLLASLIYQESEFKPTVTSWAGAFGLMQLMPSVMETYEIDSTATPKQQILAGVSHLKSIEQQLPAEITDSLQRVLFTMASYNSGLGHVLDARRLAEKYGFDANQWLDHTEQFVLKLSEKDYYTQPEVYYGYLRGQETYDFVRQITDRYGHYVNLIYDESDENQ